MPTSLSCFKAYDIRGRIPEELTLELVRKTGLAFAAEIVSRKPHIPGEPLPVVCVGRDMRLSSKDISLVLINGLEDGGVDVADIGLCGTEEVYHATFSQNFDGGIMITASHNPADWNGLKLVGENAVPLSSDSGLAVLRNRILAGDLPLTAKRGVSRRRSFRDDYISLLLSFVQDAPLLPLTIVANAGNGCAWPVMEKLLPHLPCEVVPLFPEPDGTFPNGVPNPLLPENRADTGKAVLDHGAAFGIAWDGDFDRCFFFDEQGRFIESYYIIGMLARVLLGDHPGSSILHDTRLTWNTIEMTRQAGGIPIEGKTGHAFMKERMREENALYGGEMSGHHYFRDFGYCDSGMLVWLLVYKLLSETGKPLSSMVEQRLARYPASGEINRSVKDAVQVMENVRQRYAPDALAVTWLDGLSMDMGEWRFNLRPSNTEPLLRLNVESRGDSLLMEKRRDEILAMMT